MLRIMRTARAGTAVCSSKVLAHTRSEAATRSKLTWAHALGTSTSMRIAQRNILALSMLGAASPCAQWAAHHGPSGCASFWNAAEESAVWPLHTTPLTTGDVAPHDAAGGRARRAEGGADAHPGGPWPGPCQRARRCGSPHASLGCYPQQAGRAQHLLCIHVGAWPLVCTHKRVGSSMPSASSGCVMWQAGYLSQHVPMRRRASLFCCATWSRVWCGCCTGRLPPRRCTPRFRHVAAVGEAVQCCTHTAPSAGVLGWGMHTMHALGWGRHTPHASGQGMCSWDVIGRREGMHPGMHQDEVLKACGHPLCCPSCRLLDMSAVFLWIGWRVQAWHALAQLPLLGSRYSQAAPSIPRAAWPAWCCGCAGPQRRRCMLRMSSSARSRLVVLRLQTWPRRCWSGASARRCANRTNGVGTARG